MFHLYHRDLLRQSLPVGSGAAQGQSLPLAREYGALTGALGPGVNRNALVSRPDFHGAQPLAHCQWTP